MAYQKLDYTDPEWDENRNLALERDGCKCRYCHSRRRLRVHHIRPLSMGGTHDLWNLVTLCSNCHAQDHSFIKSRGLCVIPGPEWEEYRDRLTNPEDTEKYREYLRVQGIEPAF